MTELRHFFFKNLCGKLICCSLSFDLIDWVLLQILINNFFNYLQIQDEVSIVLKIKGEKTNNLFLCICYFVKKMIKRRKISLFLK